MPRIDISERLLYVAYTLPIKDLIDKWYKEGINELDKSKGRSFPGHGDPNIECSPLLSVAFSAAPVQNARLSQCRNITNSLPFKRQNQLFLFKKNKPRNKEKITKTTRASFYQLLTRTLPLLSFNTIEDNLACVRHHHPWNVQSPRWLTRSS